MISSGIMAASKERSVERAAGRAKGGRVNQGAAATMAADVHHPH
jgi:hypothetical protein